MQFNYIAIYVQNVCFVSQATLLKHKFHLGQSQSSSTPRFPSFKCHTFGHIHPPGTLGLHINIYYYYFYNIIYIYIIIYIFSSFKPICTHN